MGRMIIRGTETEFAGVWQGSERVRGKEDAEGLRNAVDRHEKRTETQRCFLLTSRSREE